ncbi:MAG TPA: response regulator, partial [Dongiaceae bacterium]|nr:response regulator [Dongiaceae bacterium]
FTAAKSPVPRGEGRRRILLAEGDATARNILWRMFTRTNYSVDCAESGLEAVAMCENGAYDLVLMDVHLPGLEGFDAARSIRQGERERGFYIPIVVMSGHSFEDVEQGFLAACMDAYIPKPVDFKRILLVIGQILGQEPGVATLAGENGLEEGAKPAWGPALAAGTGANSCLWH